MPARALNPMMTLLVGRIGLPIPGIRLLRVHGRRSGRLHTVPVTITVADGTSYVVSVRGATDWSANLDAAGWCELVRGRHIERVRAGRVRGVGAQDALERHVARHGWATRRLLGVSRRPTGEELAALADRTPVFELVPWDEPTSGN